MEDTRLAPEESGHRTESRAAHAAAKAESAHGAYAAFGVSWEMRSDSASLHRALLERLPPGATPRAGGNVARAYALRTLPATIAERDASYLLLADGRPLLRSSEPSEIADAFEENLRWLVAERSPRRVFLRAGVVGWRDRAIVIPGGRGTGKSLLVRALVAAGATYFSDDYAVLEGNLVEPYPSQVPYWPSPSQGLACWLQEFAAAREPKPVPVGVVLFAPYQPGAVFRPKLISRGRALLGMFKHAVASQRNPAHVLRTLETVTRRCNALEGVRGDARVVAAYLLERLV
jgi:hypothetical protein